MNFSAGDRIELVHTTDPYTHLEPGDLGTVRRYDPLLDHLYVDWDSGSHLTLLPHAGDRAHHAPSL
ncbi:DUF4314 domain-containing protein [Streptomyces sp. B15]|uniref:DUF4314 domain-containing protein n=1 Tax=Streptomyces sp. B15 TaxID=1537797 RepID=UPI001B39513D|nr:DUF4314 domain-containing protein [Streptomyces sp. B15]MBQ1123772.1 DUF4314 domain-containing protein [Streptomyces sp. B15]